MVFWKIKKVSIKKTKPKKLPIGINWYNEADDSLALIFNIITTKRNNTAIAPTYTTKNNRAKNSASKSNKRPATLKNTKTKNNMFYINNFYILNYWVRVL